MRAVLAPVVLASSFFFSFAPVALQGQNLPVTASRVPLYFEENRGQTAGEVRFLARAAGYTAYLTGRETVLEYPSGSKRGNDGDGAVVRMTLAGSRAPSGIRGRQRLAGIVNYLIGSDPSKWRTRIPTYAEVGYDGVYPGVDMVYRGTGRKLEFDFLVAPGADPQQIRMSYRGASSIRLSGDGDLLLNITAGTATILKPVVYQENGAEKTIVEAKYRLLANGDVGFQLGKYDRRKLLVIDPAVSGPAVTYSTYLGSGDNDRFESIAVNSAGAAFICGTTRSASFPVSAGALRTSFPAGVTQVGFVTALNPAGTGIIYSTFISGTDTSHNDHGSPRAIAVNAGGFAFVGGSTDDPTFPIVKAFQPTIPALSAAPSNYAHIVGIVFQLAQDGASLVYSSFLGGGEPYNVVNAIAVDGANNAYVTGTLQAYYNASGISHAANFPTTAGVIWPPFLQPDIGSGFQDAFAAKIAPPVGAGSSTMAYSTLIGALSPSPSTTSGLAIAVDASGNAYVSGTSNGDIGGHGGSIASRLNMTNTVPGGAGVYVNQVWVLKLNAGATTAPYLAYLGGSAPGGQFSPRTSVSGIAVDSNGVAYVTGTTQASNFQTTANAYQATRQLAGVSYQSQIQKDAYVTVIDATGGFFQYSTYLNGTTVSAAAAATSYDGSPDVAGIVLGSGGQFAIAGITDTTDFPILFTASPVAPLHNAFPAGADFIGFITKFSSDGTLAYSALAGSGGELDADGIASNGSDVYVMLRGSANGLASTGAYDSNNSSGKKELIVRVADAPPVPPSVTVTIASAPVGLSFSVSGTGCEPGSGFIAPRTFQWANQSSCTVTFVSPQPGAVGTRYVINHWENNATTAVRVIPAPASAATYTATFDTQYLLTMASVPAVGGSVTPATGQYFNSGTVVNVQATANSGYSFVNWTGPAASSSQAATTATMSAPVSLTGNFGLVTTTTVTPAVGPLNTPLQLTATIAPAGSVFTGSLQFQVNSINFGPSIAVNGSGIYTTPFAGTTAGTFPLRAVFSSTTPTVLGSSGSSTVKVIAPPAFGKAFGAAQIAVGALTSLTFTIGNPAVNTVPLTGIGFTDILPPGLVVSTPSGLTGGCGGTITANPGGNVVSLAGGVLARGLSCTFAVNVTGVLAGVHVNSAAISSTDGGANPSPAVAGITVLAPPALAKSFRASSIPLNSEVALTFTLANPNPSNLNGLAFRDTLPAGLQVASPSGLQGSCLATGGGVATAGTVVAFVASGAIALSELGLAPGGSCSFTVNVTGVSAGTRINTTSQVSGTFDSGGGAQAAIAGSSATATLVVVAPPAISKAFGSQLSSLTFTILNPKANTVPLIGVGFIDVFPTGLTVGTNVNGSCGGGTIRATPGSTAVMLTGATLPAMGSCTFTVAITPASLKDNYTNVTQPVTSANGGTGNSATAVGTGFDPVVAPPSIQKFFGASSIQVNTSTSLSFTVSNPIGNQPLSGVAFVDNLPPGMQVTTPNNLTGECGGGTITAVAGSGSVSLSGAGLPGGVSCTFSVAVTATVTGALINTTGKVSSTNGGFGNQSSASLNVVQFAPNLTITKTHTGSFSAGQNGATYSVVVGNTGSAATSGMVTVTDILPASGLALVSMAGTGWTCGAPFNPANVCTRSDSLGAGLSYAPISVVVNVAASAPSSVTNQASVSGGGQNTTIIASDLTIIVPAVGPTNVSNSVSVVLTGDKSSAALRVTNTGSVPIAGPIQVVLTNLPWSVSIFNPTGYYNGSPYFLMTTNSLAPGASVSVKVSMYSASPPVFTPVTYSGPF